LPNEQQSALAAADALTATDAPLSQQSRLKAIAAHTDIDTVVMTMGGNDLGFRDKIIACRVRRDKHCLPDFTKIEQDLGNARDRLKIAYGDIVRQAGARLLVVGYPDIFPPPSRQTQNCGLADCSLCLEGAPLDGGRIVSSECPDSRIARATPSELRLVVARSAAYVVPMHRLHSVRRLALPLLSDRPWRIAAPERS
jgi:hypothetical protein